MPRKRDGFVPISKVDVRLPGIEGRAVRCRRRRGHDGDRPAADLFEFVVRGRVR